MDSKTKKYLVIGGIAAVALYFATRGGDASGGVVYMGEAAPQPDFGGIFTPSGAVDTMNIPGLNFNGKDYGSLMGDFTYGGGGINMFIEGPNNQWPAMTVVNNATIEGSTYAVGGNQLTNFNMADIDSGNVNNIAGGDGGGCCCDGPEMTKTVIASTVISRTPAPSPSRPQGYVNSPDYLLGNLSAAQNYGLGVAANGALIF